MTTPPWKQYICLACGLIYDEEKGDPDGGLPPGTRFEDIPEDWECPLCGVGKADFEPYEPPHPVVETPATAHHQNDEEPVVIVGAGIAGWSVAEALRGLDPALPITLVTACDGHRYHKPELSVALSRGASPEDLVQQTGADAAQRLGVRLLPQTYAVGLSTDSRQLRTTRGTLRYRALILAHGAHPLLPAVLPPELCWRVNHLDGFNGLRRALAGGSRRVAVVGAGMIGCELAEDLSASGHRVTLLDRQSAPLETLLPEAARQRLRQHLEEFGVTFLGATEITGINAVGQSKHIATNLHGLIEVDQVVVATGLVTSGRLARQAGLAFENGIVVNPRTLATSADHVYALGDCISLSGTPCRFIEPIAHQARGIAHAITGSSEGDYQHRDPVIRLKTRRLPIVLRGCGNVALPWRTLVDEPDYLHLEQRRGHQVIASLSVGRR